MKHFVYSFLALILLAGFTHAQSTINSLTVNPPNPTVFDTITVTASLMFPNSNCDLDNQSHTVTGNNIVASTLHCMGMLPTICYATDIFIIYPLAPGTYTFSLALSSGYGGPPCSPGVVPDDTDSVIFLVSNVVDIEEVSDSPIMIFPNPVEDILNIMGVEENIQQVVITGINGTVVIEIDEPENEIDVSGLSSGIYLLKLFNQDKVEVLKFVKN